MTILCILDIILLRTFINHFLNYFMYKVKLYTTFLQNL